MFAETLEKVVEGTAGAVGAVLMGYDGIAIDQYFKPSPEVDLHLVAVEYANVLKEIKRTVDVLNTGSMEEVSIKTERYFVIIRALTEEYFIALTVERDGNFGKGRYLLRREAPDLVASLT